MVTESLLNASEKRTRITGNQSVVVTGRFIWEIPGNLPFYSETGNPPFASGTI